ncbi:MAG: hypothetical protein P4L98_03365 [Ancalomicrobiaceae bacterium]|nr:hypothetical protein [Ancalomicrobiaceae bacterium]
MVGNWFLRLGALFGLVGMGLGIYMGMHHDFKLAPVHEHINVVGWLAMFAAGLYYNTISPSSEYIETIGSLMPKSAGFHLFFAFFGAVALAAGLTGSLLNLTYTGAISTLVFDNYAWGEPLMLAGSGLTVFAQFIFLINVFRGTSS